MEIDEFEKRIDELEKVASTYESKCASSTVGAIMEMIRIKHLWGEVCDVRNAIEYLLNNLKLTSIKNGYEMAIGGKETHEVAIYNFENHEINVKLRVRLKDNDAIMEIRIEKDKNTVEIAKKFVDIFGSEIGLGITYKAEVDLNVFVKDLINRFGVNSLREFDNYGYIDFEIEINKSRFQELIEFLSQR